MKAPPVCTCSAPALQEHPRKRRVNENAQIALKALRVSREVAERAIQKSKLMARKQSRANKSAAAKGGFDPALGGAGRHSPLSLLSGTAGGDGSGVGAWPVTAVDRRGPASEAELVDFVAALTDAALIVDVMDANLQLAAVQEAGCKALQLVAIDDEGAIRAVDAGAVESALRALAAHTRSGRVQAQGLRLLQCLLVDSQVRSQALNASAVDTVLAGMEANIESEAVAEQGACALASLVVSLAGRLRCVTCGGIDLLLRRAHFKHLGFGRANTCAPTPGPGRFRQAAEPSSAQTVRLVCALPG